MTDDRRRGRIFDEQGDDAFAWDDAGPSRREREDPAPRRGDDFPSRRDDRDLAGRSSGRGAAQARRDEERYEYRDWRSPEYETGARSAPPPDDYAVEDEWEEWLEPEDPRGPEMPDPPQTRAGGGGGPRRRRLSAGAVLLAMLLGFFLAGLLDAKGIQAQVSAYPFGGLRTLQLALLKPMTGISGLLRLDRPWVAVNNLMGRGEGSHHTLAEVKTKKSLYPRKITAAKPLRLYVAGDSMDQVFGSSLVNLGEATKLVQGKNDYKVSSGLSRPDFYDWPQRLVDEVATFHPDASVVLFGANDGQDVMYQGKVLKVGTKAWQEVYAKRVGEAMDILSAGGRRVYWIGNPIMRDAGYRDRIAMMNHIYQAEAAKHPGVFFISTWALMSDDKGQYNDYLKDANGESVLMRAPDGIHLTRAGGDRMAKLVLDQIMADWKMTTGASTASPSSTPTPP